MSQYHVSLGVCYCYTCYEEFTFINNEWQYLNVIHHDINNLQLFPVKYILDEHIKSPKNSPRCGNNEVCFLHRDQRGFEVTVVDSVKGNDAYIKQINYILLFSLVYFEINHISDTLRTRSICTEKI